MKFFLTKQYVIYLIIYLLSMIAALIQGWKS
jgi:hypothetical protein